MDYDLRQFSRDTLWEMLEITQANLHVGFSGEEDTFWYEKHRAINLELQRRRGYEQDPDFSRTLSGAGWSAPVVPDPDKLARQLQTRVPKKYPSDWSGSGALDRATAEGARKIGFRGASRKEP